MDNFKAIYKILQALERLIDLPAFDISELALDAMGVSTERQYRYLELPRFKMASMACIISSRFMRHLMVSSPLCPLPRYRAFS